MIPRLCLTSRVSRGFDLPFSQISAGGTDFGTFGDVTGDYQPHIPLHIPTNLLPPSREKRGKGRHLDATFGTPVVG